MSNIKPHTRASTIKMLDEARRIIKSKPLEGKAYAYANDFLHLSRFVINELETGGINSFDELEPFLKSLAFIRDKLQSLVPVGRINEELVKAYLSAK